MSSNINTSIESAQFMKAIIAEPDDESPRRIYADWLEEFGGQPELAEFIRLQCDLAHMPRPTQVDVTNFNSPQTYGNSYYKELFAGLSGCDPDEAKRYCSMMRRVNELIETHGEQWGLPDRAYLDIDGESVGGKQRWVTPTSVLDLRERNHRYGRFTNQAVLMEWEYRRGFIEVLRCSWRDWIINHKRILEAVPIREVEFMDEPEVMLVDRIDDPIYVDSISETYTRRFRVTAVIDRLGGLRIPLGNDEGSIIFGSIIFTYRYSIDKRELILARDPRLILTNMESSFAAKERYISQPQGYVYERWAKDIPGVRKGIKFSWISYHGIDYRMPMRVTVPAQQDISDWTPNSSG